MFGGLYIKLSPVRYKSFSNNKSRQIADTPHEVNKIKSPLTLCVSMHSRTVISGGLIEVINAAAEISNNHNELKSFYKIIKYLAIKPVSITLKL